jgi:phosphate transport system permease protein
MRDRRLLKDRAAGALMLALTVFSILLTLAIALGLYAKSKPILDTVPLSRLLGGTSWRPLRGEFGFLPFLMGTLWVTGVSVIIAVPLCLMTAIYLSEYASRAFREGIKPLVDLLAGIPSVVYGTWGVITVVPFVKTYVAPLFGSYTTGYCTLSAGVVLAVMIFPVVIHVCLEVFRSVPAELREASLALGATRWQTVTNVVVRRALPGIIAAVALGLSRAFGETMAVLMVAGNVARIPRSVFDPAYPLPALIANNYGEMLSIPLYDSALLLASLMLFAVVLLFNFLSQIILARVEKRIQ